MPDFTSALYLGLTHPSVMLGQWTRLTLGKPAALEPPPGSRDVAAKLARLQGCQAAILGPSTFHLFWDLFDMIAREKISIFLDEGAYPIARWAVERAACRGVPVVKFRHYDTEALDYEIEHRTSGRTRPVIVCDGFCPGCGHPAPLSEYLQIARESGGQLVIDDTQALGVLGERPSPRVPLGRGGGGSLRFAGITSPNVAVVSSLAKGFGAPLAALSGSRSTIRRFEGHSKTQVHCSPPSIASIRAAARALQVNHAHGEELRQRLTSLVHRFRQMLKESDFTPRGGWFPVQTVGTPRGIDTPRLHRRLEAHRIKAVLQRPRSNAQPRLTFLLTARHRPEEVDAAAIALVQEINRAGNSPASKDRNHASLS